MLQLRTTIGGCFHFRCCREQRPCRRSCSTATLSSSFACLKEGESEQFLPSHREKERVILGIESSCDDTGVAIVSSSGRILGESLRSQADIHASWGGVVPKLAQEAHRLAIDACVQEAMDEARIDPRDLDAVAVTIGPGLSLCLQVGVVKAHRLAHDASIPLIPVHHMEAHALVSRLNPSDIHQDSVQFPFLCLLVSGGHNMLLVVEGVGKYIQLGTTLDDALGEAYDKVARMLGLDLRPSGGAALEALARKGNPMAFSFTEPLKKRKTCDFSYAGLKTAVRLTVEKVLAPNAICRMTESEVLQLKADIAASFQFVAVSHLRDRCERGVRWSQESHPEIKHFVVAGGVASNFYIREQLKSSIETSNLSLICPPPRLCTDNGVMVAWAGLERLKLGLGVDRPPDALGDESAWVDLRPRWPLTDRRDPRSFQAPRSAKKKNIFKSLEFLTNDMATSV